VGAVKNVFFSPPDYNTSSIKKFFLALDPFPEVTYGRFLRTPILKGEEGFFILTSEIYQKSFDEKSGILHRFNPFDQRGIPMVFLLIMALRLSV
jgi:hypothetical protein